MTENDQPKTSGEENRQLPEPSGDYSYIDFVIEKKFYKRFNRILRYFIAAIAVIFGVIAFLGIKEYRDLSKLATEADIVKEKIQTVYNEYARQDSLALIKKENSQFYAYHVNDRGGLFDAIIEAFREQGFKFSDATVEDGITKFVHDKEYAPFNPATIFVDNKDSQEVDIKYIGVIYNDVPEKMRMRADSLFKDFYRGARVEYFEEKKLPRGGLLYFIR